MKFNFLLSILILFMFLSCNSEKDRLSEYINIKNLEYTRDGNIHSWQTIYKGATKKIKNEILFSIAKTKNDSLFPFLADILYSETDKNLLSKDIFAIGQLKIPSAEEELIKYFKHTPVAYLKKCVIQAFEQCGTKLSVQILVNALSNDSLRSAALQAAAILSRKKVDVQPIKNVVSDSNWTYSSSKEFAYFTYYSAENADLALAVQKIATEKNDTQKYFLKALIKILKTNVLPVDSLLSVQIKDNLKSVLKSDVHWQNKMYALQSFSFFADSTDEILIQNLMHSININLKIEAIKTYAKVFKEKSVGILMNFLQSENDFSVKGKIIYAITEINQQSAYRLIMQNMDKGSVSFKEDLLRALALYTDPIALNAIRNFLQVQQERLAVLAFNLLEQKKLITINDIEILSDTEFISLMYSLLEWQSDHNNFISDSRLISIFKSFSAPDQYEIQNLVLEILTKKNSKISSMQIESMKKNITTEQVQTKFRSLFSVPETETKQFKLNKPDYLSVDSLLSLPEENINVEINTNKGEIILELFTRETPATIQNFLKLADKNFYRNLIFHRVIPDFVIQGGDPLGTGWGGAGYTIPSEDFLPFDRGTIGMATSGFDTAGSQFFICQSEQPHLRGNYTAFGKVVKGMDIVDNIQIDDQILSIKQLKKK